LTSLHPLANNANPLMAAFAHRRGQPASARAGLVLVVPLLALLLAFTALAQDTLVPVPPLRSPVTDLTQTLSPQEQAALESRLRDFEAQKGSQIAVLIVPTTQPETIEQYSIRVADAWKIGREGPDDGVILLVAKNDRTVRIEVGTGLEGALPDVIANRIISQVIVPHFREGDFAGGINAAVTRIIAVIEGEPLPEPQRRTAREGKGSGIGNALPVLLMFVFVGGAVLRSMLGRVGGAGATAGIAGLIVWALTSVAAIAIGAAVLAFLFTLFTGGFGGGRGWSSHRGGWGGGGWGGGGWGGGGWSGGGGGFSGGGASGRW